MVSIPLPGSQSDCTPPIFDPVQRDPVQRFAHGHELGDMASLNIPDCLASIAIGKDIATSNEPLSFSLQYMLFATRLAFDQGFRVGQASSSHATPPNNISTTEQTTQTVCDSSRHFFPQTSTAGSGGDRPSSQLNPPDYIPSCINDGTDQIPRPSQPPGLHCLDDSVVSPLLNGLIQGFEPELPSGLIPVLDSDDLEDDDSDETQRRLTASHQESGRVSPCPQDSAPKDNFEHLPGSHSDDSRLIHDGDGHSEPPHRVQFLNGEDSIEDIPCIDLTITEGQSGPVDMDAEADTIRVQPISQKQVAPPKGPASSHNGEVGSVDKIGVMRPPPSPAGRQAKRKRQNPSESSIYPKKKNKGQEIDYDVTQVIWAQGEVKLRYKLDKAQQRWVTNDPIPRSLDLAEVYGEVLMSEYESITIAALENEDFRSFDVEWDTQRGAFWGIEDLDSSISHEFGTDVMWEKICLAKMKSESGL